MTITEPAMTPAEECRIAAATLQDETSRQAWPQPQWLAAMPDDVAESLVVILYCAVEWSARDEPEFEAALAFARAVNGSNP